MFKHLVATLAFLLLAGSAYAQTSFPLKYKFAKGNTHRYADTIVVQTTQEMMGQEMKVFQDIHAVTRFLVEEQTPNGGAKVVTATDTMVLKVKNPRVDTTIVPVELLHKRNRFNITALGEVTSREVIDSVNMPMLLRASGGLGSREILRLPVLSEQPVKTGEKWTYTKVDSAKADGGSSRMSTTLEYTLVGREQYAGHDCAKLSFTGKVDVNSKSTMMGMDVFTEGGGKMTGVVFFDDKAGLFVGEEGKTDMEMTAAVTGQQNMTIPITSSVKTKHILLAE
jgi:hypothetical protein